MAQELKAETIVPQGSTITFQMYPKAEVDAVLAEKDAEIQTLKQKLMKYGDTNAFLVKENTDLKLITESKDKEIRSLKRALWLARAWRAKERQRMLPNNKEFYSWQDIERKCLKKAEDK